MNTINAPEMRGAKESTHSLYTITKIGIVIGGSWLPKRSAEYATPISYARKAGAMARWLQSKRDMAVAVAVLIGLFTVALSVAYVDEPTDAQADAMVAGLGRK